MDKRHLDKLNIDVSILGYGCMRFPTTPDGKIDRNLAQPLIDKAYESGVNYFDTAYVYHNGESESFLGDALAKRHRNSYFLATKFPCFSLEKKEDVLRIFNEQLARLKTDYIDFYLLHSLNKNNWEKVLNFNVIDTFKQLKEQGKIKYLGFSFHDSFSVFKEILNYTDWDFCQIQYNYMDINIQAGDKGYRLAKKLGIPLIIMEPIKGGSLSLLPPESAAPFREMRPQDSDSRWALRWVASHDNVKVVLSGMSTMEQLTDNLNTFTNFKPMCSRQKHAVSLVRENILSQIKNGCTGCSYCVPCPCGVAIPQIFRTWNNYGMYPLQKNNAIRNVKALTEKNSYADKCVACGKCEKLCPQHLPIIEDLKRAKVELNSLSQQ